MSSNPQPSASLADYLWLHMGGLYGHRWTSAFGENPRSVGGKEWAITLAGFTQAQIDAGLATCRASGEDWPPSAPAFKAACLGIPTLAAVRAQLRDRDATRSPFTAMVWGFVDGYGFKQADTRGGDRMLAEAYDLAREQVMRGEPLPPVPEAIGYDAPPKPAKADPETAAAALAQCRSLLQPHVEDDLRAHYASLDKPVDPRVEVAP